MLNLLKNRLTKLMRSYNNLDIVITTHYITPRPIEYLSIDVVVSEDLTAYKGLAGKSLEP